MGPQHIKRYRVQLWYSNVMGRQLEQECRKRCLGGGGDKEKRLRNTVLVRSREDNKKQDNFRDDGVLKTVSHGEVIENTCGTDTGGMVREGLSGSEV